MGKTASANFLRVTPASIGDAVICTDASGRVNFLNPAAERLTGWPLDEAVGHPSDTIFPLRHEHTGEPVPCPVAVALAGRVVKLPPGTVLVSRTGEHRPIDDSAAPIRGDDGAIVGAVVVFKDVREQRRALRELEHSEQRYRALVAAMAQVVWTTDPQGRTVEDSPSWRAFTGQTFDQYRGYGWQDAIHPDDLGPVLEAWRTVAVSGDAYEVEYRLRTAGGAYRWTVARGMPVLRADGTVREWVGTNADLTARREAEAQVREQELRFRAMVEQVKDYAIFMTDPEGRATTWNEGVLRVLGFEEDDFLGRDTKVSIFTPEDVAAGAAQAELAEAASTGTAGDDRWMMRKDGTRFFAMGTTTGVKDEDGRIVGFMKVMRDQTDWKRMEESLRRGEAAFRHLADAMPQIVWTARPDGHLDYYNARWYEFTGFPRERGGDASWEPILHPADAARCRDAWYASVRTGEPYQIEYRFVDRRSGTYRWFLGRALPARDDEGAIVKWFGTCTDIDDAKQSQDELREIAARLSEADRRKDEFLATLAHELRNPLAPIRTGLEVLKAVRDDPAAAEEVRSTMERQTRQLITLVDDLLDLSRIGRGKFELRRSRIDLADVIAAAVEASRPFLDEGRHRLDVALPGRPIALDADPARLAQVVTNLLNNAAKYTPDGGEVRLIAAREGGEARIVVRDSGMGIPPEMRERIFEMFAQIDRPMEKHHPGLGIGLTLVRSIVTEHGGSVDVVSAGAGRGSEFTVRLPLADGPTPAAPAPEDAAPEAAPFRVLVVDDNAAAAELLALVIRQMGHDVRTAGDGLMALELARTFAPELVLMDLGMPRMNGYEAARLIRQEPWGGAMTLVALTGWGHEKDRRQTTEAGFDRHLVKPVEPTVLRALLSDVRPRAR